MTLEVWSHSTGYAHGGDDAVLPQVAELNAERSKRGDSSGVREGNYVVAYHLWEEGMSSHQFYQQFKDIRLAGNEDGWAMDAVLTDVTKRAGPNERVLLISVSDGAPAYAEHGQGLGHVRSVVNRWRKRGVGIVSVSVSRSLRKDAQDNMYGSQWVVPYDFTFEAPGQRRDRYYWEEEYEVGLKKATVTQMGRLIGRALS